MAQAFWAGWQAGGREFGTNPASNRFGGHVSVVARSAPVADLGGRLLAVLRAGSIRADALLVVLTLVLATFPGALRAQTAEPVDAISVRTDAPAIDLTDAVELQHTDGDRIQVSTAPGSDGIVRRIEVRAREAGKNWAVFALANNGDEQIDRLIVVPHYRMVGSGLIWPDLGQSRIVYITPSSGDPPERQESADADVFRVTLDPGTVITFVAELRTPKVPQLYLWEPDAYKDKVNSLTLYHGIVIGIAGLLALFLTILFVVKGSVMFPAAAALGWAVLVYIGIDFGFWGKVFDMSSGAERIWRASRRSDPRGDAAGVPVRLSQSEPLARALRPHHRRSGSPPSARWSASPCSRRRSPRASRASRCSWSPCSASASWSISPPTATTAR